MNINTLISVFNLFQLRCIRSDLAKLTAGPPPMPVTDLRPELYFSLASTPPAPGAEVPQSLPPRMNLASVLQERAMAVIAGRSDEDLRQMRKDLDAMAAMLEQEVSDASIRALEIKYCS